MTGSNNPAERLDSWKEIAVYLRRDVRTVQRWEKKEGLPVYRHQHEKLGSIFAYRSELAAWFKGRQQHAAVPEEKDDGKIKLVVLPFTNLNAGKKEDYFSDGLTEEMTTGITRLQSGRLAVIAHDTAMHYRPGSKAFAQMKQDLGVDYVLAGKVRRAGHRVRVTAHLTEVENHTQVWAETYERDLSDILALQAEIAQAIAAEIQVVLNRSAHARLADLQRGHGRVNPAAYEAYLKARYHLHEMFPAPMRKSIEYFEQAIRHDPDYAPAHSGLASAYALLAIAPFDVLPPHQAMPRAEAAAKRSLELDASLPEAHTALALVHHHYRWNWREAESSYQRAIELNPSNAAAHLWYSWLLLALGRNDEAVQEIEKTLSIVQETDPRRMVTVHTTRAAAYYLARQYRQAIEEAEKALELNPKHFMVHYVLGRAYALMGKNPKAIAQLKPKGYSRGEVPLLDAALGLAYAVDGKRDQTAKALEALKALAKKRYVPATYFGMLYGGLGDKKQALQWLEKACEERADGLLWLNVDPMLDGMRALPQFKDLVSRIGLV
jgi:TolB-like protein/Tfp pilus assembly protein PilF